MNQTFKLKTLLRPWTWAIGMSAIMSAIMISWTATAQQFTIRQVQALGSGCPQNQVGTIISPSGQELTLLFDNFISDLSTTTETFDKKVCVVNMTLDLPPGFSMGFVSAEYRGFADLSPNTTAQHEVLYSFDRNYGGSAFTSKKFWGPMQQPYYEKDALLASQMSWSSCQAQTADLTFRISLVTQTDGRRPIGSNPPATMSLDSLDSALEQTFAVQWRPCSYGGGQDPRPPGNGGGRRPPKFPDPNQPNGPGRPGNPGGPGISTAEIFQMYDGRAWFYTTDPRLVEQGAWVNQGIAFELPRVYGGNLANLYQCFDVFNRNYFLSTDSYCEGGRLQSTLGAMSLRPERGLAPLYDMASPFNRSDRAVTTNPQEFPQMRVQQILGYVIQTRP